MVWLFWPDPDSCPGWSLGQTKGKWNYYCTVKTFSCLLCLSERQCCFSWGWHIKEGSQKKKLSKDLQSIQRLYWRSVGVQTWKKSDNELIQFVWGERNDFIQSLDNLQFYQFCFIGKYSFNLKQYYSNNFAVKIWCWYQILILLLLIWLLERQLFVWLMMVD